MREIDRERRERRQAAEQPRRHERAMARARQRVIARRRMQQRIETIADDTQNCHGSRASACSSRQTRRNAPFIVAPPCQSEIKRTLRRCGPRPKTVHSRGFRASRSVHSTRMVNAGFPEPRRYGFEMVDAPRRRIFRVNPRINRKFTPNQIDSDFSQIFGDLTSMQTLAIYRRLLVKVDCGINRNGTKETTGVARCFSASHGILARAGARAAAQGQDA